MIQTVLGEINQIDLGITMCHEHIAMDLSPVRKEQDSVFTDEELIQKELGYLVELGCKSVIEVTSQDMGRDVLALQRHAQKTGLNIICSTGGYLRPYHDNWLGTASQDDLLAFFVKELTVGIENTGIKAGLIAEIATSKDVIYPSEKNIFHAAGKASNMTGCAVSTHCDMATNGNEQIAMLTENGASPDKIILGHIDLSSNTGYHLELLSQGVNIAFDTIGKTAYMKDETRAENIMKLLENGYENHILLSQDISRISYMKKFGGKGYTAVLQDFVPLLKQYGVTDTQINKMLVQNPARIIARN